MICVGREVTYRVVAVCAKNEGSSKEETTYTFELTLRRRATKRPFPRPPAK